MKKKIIRVLNGDIISPPPFWFMRQAGRYLPEYRKIRKTINNFLDMCYSIDTAVEITMQPIKRLKVDAAILFSDILVIPDALGQKVSFSEGIGPVLEPIRSVEMISTLDISKIDSKLSPIFQTIKKLTNIIDTKTTLIGFAGSPWTVAVYMVEGKTSKECSNARLWAYKDPHGFNRLIQLLIDSTVKYLLKQIESGVEVIQLFDSWAGVLADDQFQKWVIEPNRKIIKAVKLRYPDIPIIGFPRNCGFLNLDFVKKTGVDGISIDHSVPIKWAAEELQSLAAIQGSLDNHLLISGGKALDIRVEKILENFSNGPFIFNLGHGILPNTPPENVERVSDIIKCWGSN